MPRYILTCEATCLRALRPRGPVRELTVHRTFHHTGCIHLPCLLQAKLKENIQWSACTTQSVSLVQGMHLEIKSKAIRTFKNLKTVLMHMLIFKYMLKSYFHELFSKLEPIKGGLQLYSITLYNR